MVGTMSGRRSGGRHGRIIGGMANYVTDDAVCLRVTDFSETSQIVGLFTRRHGLVPMIAKGAKRQTKKNSMSGPLDLLTSGEVVFVPAKESGGNGGGGAQ